MVEDFGSSMLTSYDFWPRETNCSKDVRKPRRADANEDLLSWLQGIRGCYKSSAKDEASHQTCQA